MISRVIGEISDNPEILFKLSRRKVLFIFCIFVLYKIISISFDLTYRFLIFALETVFVGFKVECRAPIGQLVQQRSEEENKFILDCKYTFN